MYLSVFVWMPGVLPGRNKINKNQFPWVMDADRNRVFSKSGTDYHVLTASGKFTAAVRRKKKILWAGKSMVFIKTKNSTMIMTG